MKTIPVKVTGLRSTIPSGMIESKLTVSVEEKYREFRGPRRGQLCTRTTQVPIYNDSTHGSIELGLGGILWLARQNPLLSFKFESLKPRRGAISCDIKVPPLMKDSPKWTVNGKERFYFYEAIQKCLQYPCGSVKLPTGTGKTEIELTLANIQKEHLGPGLILVPTITIRDQFISRAEKYGLDYADYRKEIKRLRKTGGRLDKVLISTPQVVLNDIESGEIDLSEFHKDINWIIGDEAHRAGCHTWYEIFMNLPNLQRSHGFSALPVVAETGVVPDFNTLSQNDAKTIAVVGPVIYQKDAQELGDFLNMPTLINMYYDWEPNQDALIVDSDWHAISRTTRENTHRTHFIANSLNGLVASGYKLITFVDNKEQGLALLSQCRDDIVVWYGQGYIKDRHGNKMSTDELRKQYGTKIKGIISTSHAIEGLDLDSPINALVVHEGRSVRHIVQKSGRVVRPDDKPSIIVNMIDSVRILSSQARSRRSRIVEEYHCNVHNAKSVEEMVALLRTVEDENILKGQGNQLF